MSTPTPENPKVIQEEGFTGMIIDDTGVVAAREFHTDHVTADGVKQRAFVSTVVEEAYRGHGLARKIVQHTLDAALEEGYRIVAICPYVKQWIEKQDDPRYEAARDTARPEHFQRG